jgi:DNA topoisomerase-1
MGRTPSHEGMTPPEVAPRKKRRKRKANRRNGKLVIVESPAKARTVARFLGKGFSVKASVGHVRDLLRSKLSVDVENDFEPRYRVPNDKRPLVKELKAAAESAAEVYLATDPDREGEAIAWHLMEAIELEPEIARRVVFHEITKGAIDEAFEQPRSINGDLVNAQQARRVLDRLVGYKLSPLLWRKVRGRLSAGRVQSVALRLVVEREREIDDFNPQEYWTIAAELRPQGEEEAFVARLRRVDAEKPELNTEEDVRPILADMEGADYRVETIKRGTRSRNPAAPFITSTLQQEASRRLGFTARRTMVLAQQLYEGIDVGDEGTTGLITYMRTDSTNIAPQAQADARSLIAQQYGQDFVPQEAPQYRTRAKAAQEAHEAIRPTSVWRRPKEVKQHLNRDQLRLYRLIWERFLASQMAPALYDTISVDVAGISRQHRYELRASGSSIRFPGFLVLYEETRGQEAVVENGEEAVIPVSLREDHLLDLVTLLPKQHFTQPPPRYSEASLVRVLEENGIGRPSTYAPILGTLQNRGYVVRDGRRLVPTEVGLIVNDLLTEHFPNIVDVNFTAHMEEDLDLVASGEREWVEVVREFYAPFAEQLEQAQEKMPEVKAEPELVGRACPECGNELVIRWGRFGKFISCSNFPDCRHTEPWLEKIGVQCPLDGGELVERRTRRGRVFYGCANYPDCEFTSWKRPLAPPCPHCGGMLVTANKRDAECLDCNQRTPLNLLEMEPASEEMA